MTRYRGLPLALVDMSGIFLSGPWGEGAPGGWQVQAKALNQLHDACDAAGFLAAWARQRSLYFITVKESR